MLREEYLEKLLQEVYEKGTLEVYDYSANLFNDNSEEFLHTKSLADKLVRDKLIKYTDNTHTTLQMTNYGKFWILNGGYRSFLKEGQRTRDNQKEKFDTKLNLMRQEKEELVEARLKLTRYRLVGFWLMIVVTIIGLLLTLYNVYLIINGKK